MGEDPVQTAPAAEKPREYSIEEFVHHMRQIKIPEWQYEDVVRKYDPRMPRDPASHYGEAWKEMDGWDGVLGRKPRPTKKARTRRAAPEPEVQEPEPVPADPPSDVSIPDDIASVIPAQSAPRTQIGWPLPLPPNEERPSEALQRVIQCSIPSTWNDD
ncbi:hypothetical protein A2856_02560 [Candidatus Uhrbacteria bacterium RIFCSPHIGHO2_01_FULL_63_20]|uniref:Uncharacterized protein n=1 Tax=Candidatus Uhrbacteria bacterium RIFCSPHIGHO2_01_FULL_63_20 TaxID=1802385 RepID=A0A1F7TKQ5_9BACT|nr:MAG: hypothetical protein A2856_02560 [Candidatus Uhrbacteria bacterium RIFCSPHIGHO2_01_FULL_63_20]